MRIKEVLAVQIMSGLADKVYLVEHDLVGMADAVKAQKHRHHQQRGDYDRIQALPWRALTALGAAADGSGGARNRLGCQALYAAPQFGKLHHRLRERNRPPSIP